MEKKVSSAYRGANADATSNSTSALGAVIPHAVILNLKKDRNVRNGHHVRSKGEHELILMKFHHKRICSGSCAAHPWEPNPELVDCISARLAAIFAAQDRELVEGRRALAEKSTRVLKQRVYAWELRIGQAKVEGRGAIKHASCTDSVSTCISSASGPIHSQLMRLRLAAAVLCRRAHEFDQFASTVVLEDSPETVTAMLAQGSTSAVLFSVNANGTAVTRLVAGVDSVQDFQDRGHSSASPAVVREAQLGSDNT
eukprot:17314-Heterococcus_DN1.PRE.1